MIWLCYNITFCSKKFLLRHILRLMLNSFWYIVVYLVMRKNMLSKIKPLHNQKLHWSNCISINTGIKFFFLEDIPGYVYIVQCIVNFFFFFVLQNPIVKWIYPAIVWFWVLIDRSNKLKCYLIIVCFDNIFCRHIYSILH